MIGKRIKYASITDAQKARAKKSHELARQFRADAMPWRVVVDKRIVAIFDDERNARGFALARYKGDADVVERVRR